MRSRSWTRSSASSARHGLEADGVIGAGTIKALNITLAQRVRQIELAMERMRWLPELSDRPNVFVNVPLYRMWATDPATGEEPLRMNVVVGQSLNHKTPIFVEQMEYVIFRPYWNPPRSITVQELVPHARRDPGYFDREQLEIVASGADNAQALQPTPENLAQVVSGRLFLRQRPGPHNSLGLAKFIFPNAENVYMHGTPAQSLFSRARRDFSHGCIRLEDPARFAEWVLRDQPEWTRQRIDTAMKGDRPTRVNLKAPLTVVLFYDTVHVNSEGVVFFVEDIYGHDRALDAALGQGYPYPVAAATLKSGD
ncbi:MAG: L,D-transpeptidase family protein [Vicinamibacterales bacterium]